MDLKFYLNKFAKIDNIENYTYSTVKSLEKAYSDYLDKSGGQDPDFPMITFGGHGGEGGTKIKGRNAAQVQNDLSEGEQGQDPLE